MRRILLTVFALVILLPSVAMAQSYLCRTDGQARAHCCCKPKAPPLDASISRAPCCDVTAAAAPTMAPTVVDHAPPAIDAPVAIVAIVTPTVRAIAIPVRATPPPHPTPPLSVRLLL